MTNHAIRVDIIQPRVAHYRLALYEGLKKDSRIDFQVQASQKIGENWSEAGLDEHFDLNHPARLLMSGRIVWQCGLRLVKAKGSGDVLVVCGDLHFLSTIPLILRAKRRGIGVLWWTHHRSAGAKNWRVKIRLLITRLLSDCVLCYTNEGVKYLAKNGFHADRLFASGNTIDNRESIKAAQSWSREAIAAFKKTNGIENLPVFLFSSVLRKKVQLDRLLEALSDARLQRKSWHLVVVGDGEMANTYKELACSLGINQRITWVGALYEEAKLAPWFLSASYFVYPGSIGLSLLHAFSYGLPVITHNRVQNHMPEFEAFKPDVNGVTYQEGSVEDLSAKLAEALERPHDEYEKMSKEAWETAHKEYSIETMVRSFTDAILGCSRLSCKV